MSAMLPVTGDTSRNVSAVLAAAIASVSAKPNVFDLPRAESAIVVLVDGLGAANLQARAGHARFLSTRMGKRDVIRTVFPSTTAAAIASFATGRMPGQHGLVGYRVLDSTNDRLVNQLSGWDDRMRPETWQELPTLFESASESGLSTYAIGAPRYADSGFTRAVLRGAQYRAGRTIADRVDEALELVHRGPSVVYLYVPELDQIAHADGWESDRWLGALESLDGELARLDERMPRKCGLLVTADHGVIDVPARRHVFLDARPELLEGVRHIGGEPRTVALYLDPALPAAQRSALLGAWRSAEGHRSWVFDRAEAIESGLFGEVRESSRARLGDIYIAARAGIAYYDAREPNRQAEAMIGQHGSASDEEARVPLIRGGAFRRGTGGA